MLHFDLSAKKISIREGKGWKDLATCKIEGTVSPLVSGVLLNKKGSSSLSSGPI